MVSYRIYCERRLIALKHKFIKVFVALVVFLNLCFSVTSFAASLERLTDSKEFHDVVTDTQGVILDDMNAFGESGGFGVVGQITSKDIDWSRAYKYYYDSKDIFETPDSSIGEIKQKLDYVWILPIEFAGKEVYVVLSKENKWITESYVTDTEWSAEEYEANLGNIGRQADEIIIVGSTPKIQSEFVILKQTDSEIQVTFVEEPNIVADETTVDEKTQTDSVSTNGENLDENIKQNNESIEAESENIQIKEDVDSEIICVEEDDIETNSEEIFSNENNDSTDDASSDKEDTVQDPDIVYIDVKDEANIELEQGKVYSFEEVASILEQYSLEQMDGEETGTGIGRDLSVNSMDDSIPIILTILSGLGIFLLRKSLKKV